MSRNIFERQRQSFKTTGKSKTEQSKKNETNINTIMAKCRKTGQLPPNEKVAYYGDFTTVSEFQTAQNNIASATQAFEALPAKIRARFKNDPVSLLAFLDNADNRDEAVRLGIINAPVSIEPDTVTPVTEVVTESTPAA